MSHPIISLRDVSYDYTTSGMAFRALNEVSLDISEGEYVAIIGASGSGKTTLMNLLGLMTPPTSGSLRLDGSEVAALGSDDLATLRNQKIGFIFQNFNLLPRLSVLENVMLSSLYGHVANAEQRARALLKILGIADQAKKLPVALSGGQKQRVAIARALFADPKLLLADEPTGALDSQTTENILGLFDDLHKKGATLVVITHNPEVAARAQRRIRIADGAIVEDTGAPLQTYHASRADTSEKGRLPSQKFIVTKIKRILVTLGIILNSILASRGRSFLTIAGLSVGIVAIIIMVTLSAEAKSAFFHFTDSLGGNRAAVMFDMRESERLGTRRWRGLDINTELPSLAAIFKSMGEIDPVLRTGNCVLRAPTETQSLGLVGLLNPDSFSLLNVQIERGRGFTIDEYMTTERNPVALLGAAAAQKLFPSQDPGYSKDPNYPLGAILSVTGCSFSGTLRVAGIIAPMDADFGSDSNENVYVPSRMLTARGVKPYASFFQLNPHRGVKPSHFAQAFQNALILKTENHFPFRLFTAEQQLNSISMMMDVLQAITLLIGGLCTIIGGIGIMNIMLVNITERIKEIGIRKAVGARASHIRNQFLGESIVFCLVGGCTGILVGTTLSNCVMFVASLLLPRYIVFHFSVNMMAVIWALLISFGAGLMFGIMPALRASRLDVIEALRAN